MPTTVFIVPIGRKTTTFVRADANTAIAISPAARATTAFPPAAPATPASCVRFAMFSSTTMEFATRMPVVMPIALIVMRSKV